MPDHPIRGVGLEAADVELPSDDPPEAENVGAKIVSGGVVRLFSYAFATGIAVLSMAVVSREIGPASFADYATAMSLISAAAGLADFGLLALGIREFAALEGAKRERHLRALITLRLIFTFVGGIVVVIIGAASDFPAGVVAGLAAAAVGLCVSSLYVSYCVPLQATYRFNELALLDALRQGMWSGLMIAGAVVIGSVGVIVGALLPAAIVSAFAAALLARRITHIGPTWDPSTMRDLLSAVGAFAVAASVAASYAYLAQVASDAVLSNVESGQFALAFRVFAVLLGAGLVVILGAFPLLVTAARDDLERMIYATRRVMQASLIGGFACAVGMFSGASFLVAVLGGQKYEGAVELLAIIGFALPASFVLNSGNSVLLATGKHRELVVVAITGAILSIAITAALAAEFGGHGAAAGIVIGELILAISYLTVLARIDARALPQPRWLIGVLAAAAIGCSSALLGLPSVVEGILGVVFFGAAALIFGVLPPEIRDRIPLIPRRAAAE